MKIALVIAIFTLLTTAQAPAPSHATHGHRHVAAPAPAPAVDCSSLILNMADCLSFVSKGRSTTKPEQSCCSGLKSVLSTDAECLCEAFKSSAQLGVDLNVTKALTLPAACKLSALSVPTCTLSESPAAAPGPALSPALAGGSSAIGGNEQAPGPSPGNSAPVGGTLSLGYLVSALALGLFLTLKNM